ncbi:MAG: alcohol dehydrogenase catalytic domain-containing protein, partial [Acidimicrobiales bacterium]
MTTTTPAIAVPAPGAPLEPTTIERRDLRPDDVLIDIAFAGICHSDLHQAKEDWGSATFPMVPGHEIAGVVAAVGAEVTKYRVGDRVGVGCMVDSCRECVNCLAGEEQYCLRGNVGTY